jgi:hypothetical protein
VSAQNAAPEAGTSERGSIGGGSTADHNATGKATHGCIGCGQPTEDAERICADCRHTDREHGTIVTGPGRSCPWCDGE